MKGIAPALVAVAVLVVVLGIGLELGTTGLQAGTGGTGSTPCSDSDNGRALAVFGTCKDGKGSFDDSCLNSTHVNEYACAAGSCSSKTWSCGPGKLCSGGKCVQTTCADTDASSRAVSGLDRLVQGTCTDSSSQVTDSCVNSTTLREIFCSVGAKKACINKLIKCSLHETCSNGACVSRSCSDPDGTNTSVSGTCSDGTSNVVDSCFNSTAVLEGVCKPNKNCGTKILNCVRGQTCSGGKCSVVPQLADLVALGPTYDDTWPETVPFRDYSWIGNLSNLTLDFAVKNSGVVNSGPFWVNFTIRNVTAAYGVIYNPVRVVPLNQTLESSIRVNDLAPGSIIHFNYSIVKVATRTGWRTGSITYNISQVYNMSLIVDRADATAFSEVDESNERNNINYLVFNTTRIFADAAGTPYQYLRFLNTYLG